MCLNDGSKWLRYTSQQVHHFVVNDRQGESENKPNKSVELTQQTTRPHTVTCKNILIYDINSLNINRILCTTYIDTVASTYYVLYNDLQGGCSGYKIFVRSLEKRHDN